MGGSLASLAISWVVKMGLVTSEKVKFVSFGQPRTGDMVYAMIFDALVSHKLNAFLFRKISILFLVFRLEYSSHTIFAILF